MAIKKSRFRSEDWLNDPGRPDQTAMYVERYLNYGMTRNELQSGKPIIGIAQTGNDLTPCNRHHIALAKRIRDGIRDAGGIPMEFPVHPMAEQGRRPTAALDRNLAFIGLVEILHGYSIDGVVLTTGCDKTTPACIMAAAALDMPAIVLNAGPMLNGWNGAERIGSGTVIWRSRAQHARGEINYEEFMCNVVSSAPSVGHCNTMGTALTMNCMAESLGMTLPGSAAIPAAYKERGQMAYFTGERIVQLVKDDLTPGKIMTREAFINAIRMVSAIGGSSNAPVHMLAIARQVGVPLSLGDWQEYGEPVPLIVNCQPAGEYLGEDFYRAGGVPAVMHELLAGGYLNAECLTANGRTINENYAETPSTDPSVIRPIANPIIPHAGFAIMTSNFFDSALMKKSVISADFRQRYLSNPDSPNVFRVRAIVFEGPEDYHERINDPSLEIDQDCILVMRNCGPLGYPGAAEVVNMLPPDKLLQQGVAELPCLGDGRQSGTSGSPSILNVSPEAAACGDIALLETGDVIQVDLNNNRVDVQVDSVEWTRRRNSHKPLALVNQTPWQEIYRSKVGSLATGAVLELEDDHTQIIARHGTPRHSH